MAAITEAHEVNLAFGRLSKALSRFGTASIRDEERDALLEEVYAHHQEHLEPLQTRAISKDPFKFIAWAGFLLAQKRANQIEEQKAIVWATIHALNSCLWAEPPRGGHSVDTLEYLRDYTVNELQKRDKFGIGMNGLFVAFHCSSMIKRKSLRAYSSGWGGGSRG